MHAVCPQHPQRPLVQAYLAGLTFALAASPCSTPVLATLLAFVASTGDAVKGGSLLLAYTSGCGPRCSCPPAWSDSQMRAHCPVLCRYVVPLLVAATFTGALTQVMAVRQWSTWITPASGILLVSGGTYGLLSRVIA